MSELTQQRLYKIIKALEQNVLPMTTAQIQEKSGITVKTINYIVSQQNIKKYFIKTKIRLNLYEYKLSAHGHCHNLKKPQLTEGSKKIDLALSILCKTAKYGETLSCQEIAEVCECSSEHIRKIQYSALVKIKNNDLLRSYNNDFL